MFRRSSIGIVGICHGYESKIEGWIKSINSLNRKPDEVVLVLNTDIDRENFDLNGIKVIDWSETYNFSLMLNAGFENCNCEYIAWIGIDDRYRPNALDKCKKIKADVVAFGLQVDNGDVWIPQNLSKEEVLKLEQNVIPCGSLVRKVFWENNKFDPLAVPIDDWAFWVGVALQNATFESTGEINFDYEFEGHVHPSLESAQNQIRKFVESKYNFSK